MNNQKIYSAWLQPPSNRLVSQVQIVAANEADCDDVVALFGALHRYNASLDGLFALSDDWESLLRQDFAETFESADKQWMLAKSGQRAIGLMIAAVHTDSAMFRHRQWVEVEGLYVEESHRGTGLAQRLLRKAYNWALEMKLPRVQLYVTASNERAKSVYDGQGFAITQAIMRKSL